MEYFPTNVAISTYSIYARIRRSLYGSNSYPQLYSQGTNCTISWKNVAIMESPDLYFNRQGATSTRYRLIGAACETRTHAICLEGRSPTTKRMRHWWLKWDSHPRPSGYEPDELTTALFSYIWSGKFIFFVRLPRIFAHQPVAIRHT